MASNWSAVLDALDMRVEEHRKVLFGETPLERYALPRDLGPLPIELVGRACAILARQREVEDELAAHMAVLRNLFTVATPAPVYFDESA